MAAPATTPFFGASNSSLCSHETLAKLIVRRHGDSPMVSRPSRMTTTPAMICSMPCALPMIPVWTSTAPRAAAMNPTSVYIVMRAA